MLDEMLHCIVIIQDRCSDAPPRAKQHEVLEEMLRTKVFTSAADLTFTQLVQLAMMKGLASYDAATGHLTACAVGGEDQGAA